MRGSTGRGGTLGVGAGPAVGFCAGRQCSGLGCGQGQRQGRRGRCIEEQAESAVVRLVPGVSRRAFGGIGVRGRAGRAAAGVIVAGVRVRIRRMQKRRALQGEQRTRNQRVQPGDLVNRGGASDQPG